MAAQFSNDIDSDLHSWLQDVIETSTELMGQLNDCTITITDDKALRNTFDTALAEDARPWFHEHPVGALDVIILRRIAYNAMALFRARTLRADAHRSRPGAPSRGRCSSPSSPQRRRP